MFYSEVDAWVRAQDVFESDVVNGEVWTLWFGCCIGLLSNDCLFFLRYTLRAKSVAIHINTLTGHVLTLQLEGSAILILDFDIPIARSHSIRLT